MTQPASEAKDPVCGMMVQTSTAQWTSDHAGQKYFFCAKGCKDAFDGDPNKFLRRR